MWLGCLIPELCCWFSHSSGFIWNSAFLMPAGTACVGLFWFSINCCIFPLHSRRTGGIPAGSGVAGPQQGFYVPITVIGPCWRHLGGKTNPYALGSYSGKKEGGYSPSKHWLKVRALTPYPLSCALLVRYQQLPVPFRKEIPFIHPDSSFPCFSSPH